MWTDEGVAAEIVHLDWYNFLSILWHHEANMTLYFVLLREWSHMGDSVTMLRGLSAFCSLANIPAVYVLGRRLFSTGVGLAAALLFAVNAYSVRYAQETRSYSLVTLLATLATYFFLRAAQSGRKQDWSWYVILSTLAIYAHLFAVLVIIAHGLTLLSGVVLDRTGGAQSYRSGAMRYFSFALLCIGALSLPVWSLIFRTGMETVSWIPPTSLLRLVLLFMHMSGNSGAAIVRLVLQVPGQSGTGLLLCLCPLYLILAGIGAARAICWRQDCPEASVERWLRLLPLFWFVAPIVITLAVSLLRPIFMIRYLIVCMPALVLMVSAGVMSLRTIWLRAIVVAVVGLLGVRGVQAYYESDFDLAREDFRTASEYVLSEARPGDAVLFYKRLGRFPFSYYADHMHLGTRPEIVFPGTATPTWRTFTAPVSSALLNDLAHADRRMWLVMSENMEGEYEDDVTVALRTSIRRTHQLVAERQFENVKVYLYE